MNLDNSLETQGDIVKDFLLVANEYCMLIENMTEFSKKEFLEKIQKILSLTYLKASVLPAPISDEDLYVEKFVQEDDWQFIQNALATKLGSHESFFDISTPETVEFGNNENISLSEAITDVYQDMKDIVTLFEIATPESLEGGLFDCKMNFERYWGPRLLAVLSVLHNIIYGTENLDDESSTSSNKSDVSDNRNTDNWIINKRFDDFRK